MNFSLLILVLISKKIDKYIVGKKLGSGSFADVYLVQDSTNNKEYAMKCILKSKLNDSLVQKLQNEIAIIQTVKHPNIVQCHDILQSQNRYFIIMDYISDGDLVTYFSKSKQSEDQIASLFIQIFSAVRFVHKFNIVHRDLKLDNVLLQKDRAIITDFGLGNISDPNKTIQTATTMCGSSAYMAPEILSGHYDAQAADIYSLGIMLFVAVMQEFPFKGSNSYEIIQKAGRYEYDQPKCSIELQKLIQSIIKPYKQRATWDQIFHSPFFEKYTEFIDDYNLKIKNTNIQCKFLPLPEEVQIIHQKLYKLVKITKIQEGENQQQTKCLACNQDLEYLSNAEILNYKIKKAVSLNKYKLDPLESLSICAKSAQAVFPSKQIVVLPHKGRVQVEDIFECACYMSNGKKVYARIGCQNLEEFTKFQAYLNTLSPENSYKQELTKFKVICQ